MLNCTNKKQQIFLLFIIKKCRSTYVLVVDCMFSSAAVLVCGSSIITILFFPLGVLSSSALNLFRNELSSGERALTAAM